MPRAFLVRKRPVSRHPWKEEDADERTTKITKLEEDAGVRKTLATKEEEAELRKTLMTNDEREGSEEAELRKTLSRKAEEAELRKTLTWEEEDAELRKSLSRKADEAELRKTLTWEEEDAELRKTLSREEEEAELRKTLSRKEEDVELRKEEDTHRQLQDPYPACRVLPLEVISGLYRTNIYDDPTGHYKRHVNSTHETAITESTRRYPPTQTATAGTTTDTPTPPPVTAATGPETEACHSAHPSPSNPTRRAERSPQSAPLPFATAAVSTSPPSTDFEESCSSTASFAPFIAMSRSTVSPCGTSASMNTGMNTGMNTSMNTGMNTSMNTGMNTGVSTSASSSASASTKRAAALVPCTLPCVLGPYTGLSPTHASPLLAKDRFPFPPSSLPLSPRDAFYPPTPPSHSHSNPAHAFTFPSSMGVRPVQTSGLPWPIQPVPLRVPLGLRPDFGACGVVSPEEVPSPPGSAVADMPASPILGVRSPGLDHIRGFAESGALSVDINNNSGGLAGEDVLKGGLKNQSFKAFLESAKVRVETINDGNGLKNPLLSPDKARLPIDNGPISFMTLDAFPSCPVCGLKCDTPRLLQRHVRSHKEIKRYLCAWCGKGFNDTFDLKRHTRTHTGVRPYKCESCGKAFTQRCSLESHCRKIHGHTLPFTFNERRAKLYVCEECGHSTSSIENHFRHLRAQHPGHPALGRPHHDRRQYKFCSKERGEEEEGEEEEEEEEEGEQGENGLCENGSCQQCQDDKAIVR